MKIDRNAIITVTGTLGHALPLKLGDLIDEIRQELAGDIRRAIEGSQILRESAVRPT